jgi:dUTP pyrophosphatase
MSPWAKLPARATAGSAGCDLCAATEGKTRVPAGETVKIPTGISVGIPTRELVGLVFARSGLSVNAGVSLANAVAVIDSDYRGEIVVALRNHSPNDYFVEAGERIAQLLVMPVVLFEFEEADELGNTQRGDGGFGSTGTR